MPAPLPDTNRDHQCHHYQAPSGQRCGSPAMKGEYYCYHHLVKNNYKKNHRVLIDPEVTCMEIPPIEDRASIFIALAAVVHRLAENTIDTRRAGQMIYGLQVAMRALEPPPSQRAAAYSNKSCHSERARRAEEPRETAPATTADPTSPPDSPTPKTILITKESLLYFLRSRHCYNCNAELFPAHELTERSHAGAPAEIIEEVNPRLPAPGQPPAQTSIAPVTATGANNSAVTLNAVKDPGIYSTPQPGPPEEKLPADYLNLDAVASAQDAATSNLEPGTSNLYSTFITPFALHSARRSVSLRLVHTARHIPAPRTVPPHRIENQKVNRRKKWQQLMKK